MIMAVQVANHQPFYSYKNIEEPASSQQRKYKSRPSIANNFYEQPDQVVSRDEGHL